MQNKTYTVYIVSNFTRTVLYAGSSSNLVGRIWQHKTEVFDGYTKRYKCHDLLYYEILDSAYSMVEREQQLKKYSRKNKEQLIKQFNPALRDLYEDLI